MPSTCRTAVTTNPARTASCFARRFRRDHDYRDGFQRSVLTQPREHVEPVGVRQGREAASALCDLRDRCPAIDQYQDFELARRQ
jgi:hypothetical protein